MRISNATPTRLAATRSPALERSMRTSGAQSERFVMSPVVELNESRSRAVELVAAAPFFVRGKLVEGAEARHKSRDLGVDFTTPGIDLDALIAPRTEPGPLFD